MKAVNSKCEIPTRIRKLKEQASCRYAEACPQLGKAVQEEKTSRHLPATTGLWTPRGMLAAMSYSASRGGHPEDGQPHGLLQQEPQQVYGGRQERNRSTIVGVL